MPIETGTYISDLVATNPVGATDTKATLDDHIRLHKQFTLNTWPNITGAVTVTHTQLNTIPDLAPKASPALTGTPTAPTAAAGTSTTQIATTAFVAGTAFSSALPAQTGNSGKYITTDGSTASWAALTAAPITRSARTSNTVLGVADKGAFIDITSGTFSQTFAAAATLGDGWSCHIRNSGTGTVTLDPDGAETIDGATTLTLGPGASVLLQCTGTALFTTQSERAGTGSALTLLATLTPTAAANVDALSTFSAAYDNYLILVDGVKPATDAVLAIRFGVAGTADAGSNYYRNAFNTEQTSAATSANFVSTTTAAGIGIALAITVMNANDATNGKVVAAIGGTQSAATPGYTPLGVGSYYKATNAVSGIRFLWSTGANFAATGSIRIYGYNNT